MAEEIEEFREKMIISSIIDTELKERSMLNWLSTLYTHSFEMHESVRLVTLTSGFSCNDQMSDRRECMRAGLKGRVSMGDLQCDGSKEWMSTGEELVDKGLSELRSAGTGKVGDIPAVATLLEGVLMRGQGVGDEDR